jgi:hypothetical protein
VEPFIGSVRVGALDADILDSLYAELRRCRMHCTGPFVEHRTDGSHACDGRCRPHRCTALGPSAIRQVHRMLSGAFRSAVRWKWVSTNPVSDVAPGRPPQTNPQPPSSRDAARIVAEAVAGRLGHGGGGTTTLKYYAGWVAEAEQRAAISLGARMPQRDWRETSPAERAKENPRNPYEVVACAVRQAILAGEYAEGDPAPTVTGLGGGAQRL